MISELYIRGIRYLNEKIHEDSYVFDLPIVQTLSEIASLPFDKPVTFFVGENGTGKSTLLEAIAIACGFNAEGGTKNFQFSSQDTHSPLHEYLRITKGVKRPDDGFFLRAESFYNVASEIDRLDKIGKVPLVALYGGKSLHNQSHGESFLSLILNRFSGNGLYLLDEPEAALSPSRQLTLLAQIDTLVKQNSQLLIATHSPILLAYPNADIYVLKDNEIQKTSYKETEHYQLTKQFLDSPERMLHYLFDE